MFIALYKYIAKCINAEETEMEIEKMLIEMFRELSEDEQRLLIAYSEALLPCPRRAPVSLEEAV